MAEETSKDAGNCQTTSSKRVKERRQYTEDCLQDDEIEGRRMFSVEDKLVSDKFELFFVKEMKGTEFNLRYIQEHGFDTPVVVKEKTGLGMRMPSSNFTVNDVRQCVGSRRLLDVMDVTTQKDIEMTMKDWCRYFESTNRDKLLNVISLEFSHTKLENYVESPTLVRQADWVDLVWPRHLKESQTEGTNVIEEMKYPKVQKYCLMSVKGCYTDFHIDFGGTSVWYHIMRGQKVFWLIPPTERNLQLYEQWVLSGKQGDVFFGDTVEKCAKVHLHAGYTFFIPTGWIHAVFTPEDSLVFGGNFLHSFGMEKQIRIFAVEDVTHVPPKFRYPFYIEMMWYVLQRYVFCLIGKNHLICNENGDPISPNEAAAGKGNLVPPPVRDPNQSISASVLANGFSLKDPVDVSANNDITLANNGIDGGVDVIKASFPGGIRPYVHLNKMEYNGLKVVYKWLQSLPINKKSVPELLRSYEALLADVKIMLHEHKNDDVQLALTGQPSLFWSIPPKKRSKQPRPSGGGSSGCSSKSKSGGGKSSNNNARRRRTRCKKCEACLRADCGECHFCKDMKKFGGPGRMKQSCISRQCMAPVLPHTACCMLCGRDGWEKVNNPQENEISSLMECSQCWEIVHPACLHDKNPDLPMEGLASDDLPNSWECPKCCRDGKPDQVKPRNAKTPVKTLNNVMPLNLVTTGGIAMDLGGQVNPLALDTQTNLLLGDEENLGFLAAAAASLKGEVRFMEEGQEAALEPMRKKVKSEDMTKVKHEFIESPPSSGDENNPSDMKALQRIANRSSSLSSIAEAEDDNNDVGDDKLLLREIAKKASSTSHVRSCARFTLNPKAAAAIKEEKESVLLSSKSVSPTKLTLKYSNKVVGLDLRRPVARPLLGVNGRKHGETARERLFRNLKGLKKNSELLRHNVLRVKTKNLTSESSMAQNQALEAKVVKLEKEENVEARTCRENSGDEENSDTNKSNGLNEGKDRKNGEKTATNPAKRFSVTLREKANLRKPKYVVRPAPILEDTIKEKQSKMNVNKINDENNLALEKEVMLPVFQYLPVCDLLNCQLVCKSWNRWSIDSRLWTYMDVSRKKITPNLLMGIIRRQPISLNLSWTNINRRQLFWLVSRLPQMKDLVLSGCAAVSILALCTSSCPLLRSLDLCWAEGLTDSVIRDLLSPPTDSRPGFVEAKTRLRQLMEVRLAGADISDVAVRLLAHHLPQLSRMDLSHCHKVTDMGIAVLGAAKSARLTHLDVSSCSNISDTSLEALKRCANLMLLDMRECPQVTEAACQKFVSHGRHVLTLKEGRLMERIYS